MLMQDFARFATAAAIVPAAPVISGLAAGTPVEARAGWCPAEDLRPGAAVYTLDGGLRPLAAIDRRWVLPGMAAEVIAVPGGAFGNCADLMLLPDQHLLVDLHRDDPVIGGIPDALAVLIPAAALEGFRGATRVRAPVPLQVLTLMFGEDELVWAASGVLLHCPAVTRRADALPQVATFPTLSLPAARRLLAARTAQDDALPAWVA